MGRGPKPAAAPRARRNASSGGKGHVVMAGPEYLRPKPGRALQPGRARGPAGGRASVRRTRGARNTARALRSPFVHEAATLVTRPLRLSRGYD